MADLDKLMEDHFGAAPEETAEEIAAREAEEAKAAAEAKEEEEEAARLAALENETEEEKAAREAAEEEEDDGDIILGEEEEEEETEEEKAARIKKENEVVDTINDETFLAYASKKLGREITSLSDLTASEDKQTSKEYSSEQVRVLDEFVKETGRSVEDWYNMQRLDVENMGSEQLIKSMLKLDYPMLSDTQINKKYISKYKLDKDAFTADEIELGEIDLKIDAEKARATLSKMRDGYKVPVEKQKEVDQAAELEKFKKQKAAYTEQMLSSVDKIEMFSFDVDGSKVKYKPSKDDINAIKDANQNLETFFDRFKDDKGQFDFESLSLAMHFSKPENVAKLIKAVKGKYINEGKDKEIRKKKNTKLPDQASGDDTESTLLKKSKADFQNALLSELGAKKRTVIKL